MAEAGGEHLRSATQPADGEAEFPAQLGEILAAAVLQLDPLQVIPDALVRIQVGCVRRQLGEVESGGGPLREEVLDHATAMDRRTVPHDQQRAGDLPEQVADEVHDRRSPKRPILHAGEEPPVRGDRTDRREVVVGERRAQHRRLAAGGIRPGDERQRIEAGFVYEEDGARLRPGFA